MDTFQDDVIIHGDDGNLYQISQGDLLQFKQLEWKTNPKYAALLPLLDAGVALAVIPVPSGSPHGSGNMMCYLLNLTSLKTPDDSSKS